MGPDPLMMGARALRYWDLRQQTVANNLANAETDGFKAERVFSELLADALPNARAVTDLREGAVAPTGNPLDVAITGAGFFVVSTPAGERFSRGGTLGLDEEHRLVDGAGNLLLADDGPLIVPAGELTIDAEGVVAVDGQALARLRVERPAEGARLFHEGGVLFRAEGETTSVAATERGIRQGHLERSNVNMLESMVDMITIQRSYAAVHSGLRTVDGVMDTIANQIGRVG